jgi:hypothetical protein
MDLIELTIAFALGLAGGYAIRAAISAIRRRKAYRYRHERALREAEAGRPMPLRNEVGRLRASAGVGANAIKKSFRAER